MKINGLIPNFIKASLKKVFVEWLKNSVIVFYVTVLIMYCVYNCNITLASYTVLPLIVSDWCVLIRVLSV